MRWSVALLLLAAAVVFVIGVSIERSQADRHGTNEAGGEQGAEQHLPESTEGPDEHPGETGAEAPQEGNERASEKLFGIDTESIPVVTAAVAVAALLALAVLASRAPAVLIVVVLFGLAAMAFDIREAVHQADESRTAIVTLASATLHLAVGLLATATGLSRTEAPSS